MEKLLPMEPSGLEPLTSCLQSRRSTNWTKAPEGKASEILTNRENRIRTCDPLVPNQVLYQAELLPVKKMRIVGIEPTTAGL